MSDYRGFAAEMRAQLLKAPDSQLDRCMFPKIEKWSDPPTALQVLEVLDACIYSSLASGLVIRILQMLYDEALQNERATHEELVLKATWRSP